MYESPYNRGFTAVCTVMARPFLITAFSSFFLLAAPCRFTNTRALIADIRANTCKSLQMHRWPPVPHVGRRTTRKRSLQRASHSKAPVGTLPILGTVTKPQRNQAARPILRIHRKHPLIQLQPNHLGRQKRKLLRPHPLPLPRQPLRPRARLCPQVSAKAN
jgi:hypothetical protein